MGHPSSALIRWNPPDSGAHWTAHWAFPKRRELVASDQDDSHLRGSCDGRSNGPDGGEDGETSLLPVASPHGSLQFLGVDLDERHSTTVPGPEDGTPEREFGHGQA